MIIRTPDAHLGSANRHALTLRVRRGIHFVVVAAIVWVLVLTIAGILVSDGHVIARLTQTGPSIAAMTFLAFAVNHLLRFARWQWMLVRLAAYVPSRASFAVFMAGLGLLPTPGKIGVAARSVLLMDYGVPVTTSLAAYFAERLFDLVGLLMLAAIFYRGPLSSGLTVIAAACGLCIALVARYPDPFIRAMRGLVNRWANLLWAVDAAAGLLNTAKRLFTLPQALGFVLLGAFANIVVGLLVWGVLAYLSRTISFGTGIGAVAVAHLSGSASMAPGGLGTFELALALDLGHTGVHQKDALVVVTCVRIVTLWGSVMVGLPLMLLGLRRHRPDWKTNGAL